MRNSENVNRKYDIYIIKQQQIMKRIIVNIWTNKTNVDKLMEIFQSYGCEDVMNRKDNGQEYLSFSFHTKDETMTEQRIRLEISELCNKMIFFISLIKR